MKTVFSVNVHSFVDLITNSSSELFVCNGKKSLEAVEELLKKLVDAHNLVSEDKIDPNHLFTGILKKPSISEHTFHYYKFPSNLREEYEKYHNMHSTFEHVWWGGDSRNFENGPRYIELQEKERAAQTELKVHDKNVSEEERSKRWSLFQDKCAQIWKEWAHDSAKATLAMFKWWLSQHGYTEEQLAAVIPEPANNISRYTWLTFADEKVNDLYNTFSHYMSYGIDVDKGSILIESAEDNSVPYELMGSIETYLGTRRWHIG